MMIMPQRHHLLVTCLCASYSSLPMVIVAADSRILLGARQSFPAAAPLYSLSSPQQQQNEPLLLDNKKSPPLDSFIQDAMTLVMYSCWCCLVALVISMYQDFDVSHIKPQGILRDQALYGMAYSGNDENSILSILQYSPAATSRRETETCGSNLWKHSTARRCRPSYCGGAAIDSRIKENGKRLPVGRYANSVTTTTLYKSVRRSMFRVEKDCSIDGSSR